MARRNAWLLAMLVVAAATPNGVTAQQKGERAAAKGTTLTAQDRIEIEQLVGRYAWAYDSGAENCYAYADLFTSDGDFTGTRGRAKGRDALAEYCRGAKKPSIGVSHFIMNHVIDPTADGATGKQYLVVVSIGENNRPGGEFTNTGGHYEDVYAKTSKGWRFKSRAYIPSKSAPRSTKVAAGAQQGGGKAQTGAALKALTAQDYLDIRALANRYAYGLDTGAENGTGSVYASVFAEDAEFHGPGATPGGAPFDAKGREALRQFAVGGRGSAYVRHFMTNHWIEPSAEGATGKVYLLVLDIGQGGQQTSVNMGGHYEDVYVRTAEGWRIKNRNFFRSKSAQTLQAEAAAAGAKPAAQAK